MDQMELSMQNVSVFYGPRPVIDDVSLDISPGRTTIVLGSSGSGKSIFLKTIAGLVPPSRGMVMLNGKNIFSLSEKEELEFRRRSSFVFQDAALWANRTVAQNVRFPLEVHYPVMSDQQKQQKVDRYLERVGYQDSIDYRPSQISAGEQKMVSFARALITDPDLLFLDTPLVGIDSTAAGYIEEIIKKLRGDGKTILAGLTDPELISLIADELIIIHKGAVLIHGPFNEVRRSDNPLVQKILSLILDQAAAYDEDILSILDDDGGLL
ncbi:MAG: ATP-binding cassette domain-containing protein [Spirochaetota bacterium]|nr:ATP-binding cassette domain-containing protein [Spirochaetota bacterium]